MEVGERFDVQHVALVDEEHARHELGDSLRERRLMVLELALTVCVQRTVKLVFIEQEY